MAMNTQFSVSIHFSIRVYSLYSPFLRCQTKRSFAWEGNNLPSINPSCSQTRFSHNQCSPMHTCSGVYIALKGLHDGPKLAHLDVRCEERECLCRYWLGSLISTRWFGSKLWRFFFHANVAQSKYAGDKKYAWSCVEYTVSLDHTDSNV